MCLIVDADCAARLANGDADALPVVGWLLKTDSRLVVGGRKLDAEYKKVQKFSRILGELSARGQVKRFDGSTVDKEAAEIEQTMTLSSNDHHVIALARISGTRLLFSKDQKLHQDFGNPQLLSPKGRVYQNEAHKHLLTKSKC